MDNSTTDKIEPTGRGPVLDVEHGQSREIHGKTFHKNSKDRLKATTSVSPDQSLNNENSGERTIVLSFRPLQLRRIEALQDVVLNLQVELAATRLTKPDEVPAKEKEIDEALNMYATALRNYETLSQNFLSAATVPMGYTFAGKGALPESVSGYLQLLLERERQQTLAAKLPASIRPWIPDWIGHIRTESRELSDVLPASVELPKSLKVRKEVMRRIDESLREIGHVGFRELDKAGREERERKTASTLRLTMGLFGCIALIVPMLIMALHPKKDVALVTTSIVTILFAVIVAFGARDSSGQDVLLVTAAYAAVFVVFVGSSLSAS